MFPSLRNSMTTRSSPAICNEISAQYGMTGSRGLTDTTTGVRGSSQVEGINVALHARWLDTTLLHPLDQEFGIVNSLRAG